MDGNKIVMVFLGAFMAVALPAVAFLAGQRSVDSPSIQDGTSQGSQENQESQENGPDSGGSEASGQTGATTPSLRNVLYYSDWSIWGGQENYYPQDLPLEYYTHVNYAFLDLDALGNLVFTDPDASVGASLDQEGVVWGEANAGIFPALRAHRGQHPNVKLGVSVGGWSKSADFPVMAASDSARANFVEQMMQFLRYTDFDTVDIDWEYPGIVRQPDLTDNVNDEGNPQASPGDKENYIKLLQDLRTAMDLLGAELGKTFELSVALPMDSVKLEAGVDVATMFSIIDFGNVMTYDGRGAFDDVSGHHSPLYGNPADPFYDVGFSIDQSVNYLLSQGAPSEKIVIGAAFYSRGWENIQNTEVVAGLPGLFAPATSGTTDADASTSVGASNDLPTAMGDGGRNGGIWAYRNHDQLHATYPGLVEYWDDVAKAPYLYNGSAFFTYDNPQSLEEKAKYVLEKNLGGVISWQAGNDAVSDVAGQRDTLGKALFQGLFGGQALANYPVVTAPLNIGCQVVAVPQGYEITLWNHEVTTETNSVLQALELQKKTLLLPKLYLDNKGVALMAGTYNAGQVYQEGDFTVVDLATVYESRLVAPGYAVVFQLHYQDSTTVSLTNLQGISLGQRATLTGGELSRQVIFGEGTEAPLPGSTSVPGSSTGTASTGTEQVPETVPDTSPVDPNQEVLTWNRQDEAVGVYVPGVVVSHNGKTYRQVGSAVAWWAEPGTDPGMWQEIS